MNEQRFKHTIRVVYPCGNTAGYNGTPERDAWLANAERVFALLGWKVTSQGPTMSSTNIDEDELNIASDGELLTRPQLLIGLSAAGIEPHYWTCWSGGHHVELPE